MPMGGYGAPVVVGDASPDLERDEDLEPEDERAFELDTERDSDIDTELGIELDSELELGVGCGPTKLTAFISAETTSELGGSGKGSPCRAVVPCMKVRSRSSLQNSSIPGWSLKMVWRSSKEPAGIT